jgi:CRISPR/Cas system-associated exonuclease Cas4 (RecB family)
VKVIEKQRSFEWKEYQITGHIDGKVLDNGEVFPLEIKSCSPFVFKAINSISDLTNGKYGYLRKYPAQLNLYLLMDGNERGVFIFKDKTSGQMKEIWMDVDYELGEETLKRSEAINKHLAEGTLPDPINDDLWCDGCAFAHICLPETIGKEVEIDTGELSILLDRLEELKPSVKEYEEIDDQVKKAVEGREKILAGNFLVTGKWLERVGYNLPAGLKEQYRAVTRYWKRKVLKVAA